MSRDRLLRPHAKPDPQMDDKCSVLYQTGLSSYQVARRLGLTQYQVMAALQRTNTQMRTISEAKRIKSELF